VSDGIGLDEVQLFLKVGAEVVLGRCKVLAALLFLVGGLDLVGSGRQVVNAAPQALLMALMTAI
jgi:hypothetical protein